MYISSTCIGLCIHFGPLVINALVKVATHVRTCTCIDYCINSAFVLLTTPYHTSSSDSSLISLTDEEVIYTKTIPFRLESVCVRDRERGGEGGREREGERERERERERKGERESLLT